MTRKEATEGTIASFYTLNGWFVKVYQAYNIDKVKFSFVKKGEHGNGFDIYVDIDEFDNLCDEILSGQLFVKIQNETGDYPSSWKYVTGEKGSKELAIGKGQGQNFAVIQGRDKGKKLNAFVGIADYNKLKNMAKWFRRSSEKYISEMCNLINNSDQYRPKEDKKNQPMNVTFTSAGMPEYVPNDGYYVPVRMGNDVIVRLQLKEGSLPKIGNWQAFISDVSQRPIRFSMNVKKLNNDNYLFIDNFKTA